MIGGKSTTTNYLFNVPPHGPSQIQQAGTSMCSPLDHAAGKIVLEAACNGASYQHWTTESNVENNYYVFVSQCDPSRCLAYNA